MLGWNRRYRDNLLESVLQFCGESLGDSFNIFVGQRECDCWHG